MSADSEELMMYLHRSPCLEGRKEGDEIRVLLKISTCELFFPHKALGFFINVQQPIRNFLFCTKIRVAMLSWPSVNNPIVNNLRHLQLQNRCDRFQARRRCKSSLQPSRTPHKVDHFSHMRKWRLH